MSIPLRIAEPTGRYNRALRRFVFSGRGRDCPAGGYHNASADIGEITDPAEASGDNWPHGDPRWPDACGCGYGFGADDEWQRNDREIYQLPDGTEFALTRSLGMIAPAGTMIRAAWYDGFSQHPDGIDSWLVALPDGGDWITSQEAKGGGYWTVTGIPPLITATPSIFHNAPHGWHGFITNGELTP